MANKFRNEVDVVLNDNTYTLRATFDFFVKAGDDLDTVGDFINGVSDQQYKIKDVIFPVYNVYKEGSIASGNKVDFEQLKDDITIEGIGTATMKLQEFWVVAVLGAKTLDESEQEKKV